MGSVFQIVATAAFALAVILLVVSIVIFIRLDVRSAIAFLRHKRPTAGAGKTPVRRSKSGGKSEQRPSRKPRSGKLVAGSNRTTAPMTKASNIPTQPAKSVPSFASDVPTTEVAKLGKHAAVDRPSNKPTDNFEAASKITAPVAGTPAAILEASENPTDLLVEEASEQPTGLLAEEPSESPTSVLVAEESESPTGLLVEEESEKPTGLLVEESSEKPTGLLVEEESEKPTSILVDESTNTGSNFEENEASFKFEITTNIVVVHTDEQIL